MVAIGLGSVYSPSEGRHVWANALMGVGRSITRELPIYYQLILRHLNGMNEGMNEEGMNELAQGKAPISSRWGDKYTRE